MRRELLQKEKQVPRLGGKKKHGRILTVNWSQMSRKMWCDKGEGQGQSKKIQGCAKVLGFILKAMDVMQGDDMERLGF